MELKDKRGLEEPLVDCLQKDPHLCVFVGGVCCLGWGFRMLGRVFLSPYSAQFVVFSWLELHCWRSPGKVRALGRKAWLVLALRNSFNLKYRQPLIACLLVPDLYIQAEGTRCCLFANDQLRLQLRV